MTTQTRLKTAEKRLAELNRLFDKLYEDNVSGRISQSNFERMVTKYQDEQAKAEQQIAEMQAVLKGSTEVDINAENWVNLIRDYVSLQTLTTEVLNELICKIVVHDRKTVDGVLMQDIEVHYRFVGLLKETEYAAKVLPNSAQQRWANRDIS